MRAEVADEQQAVSLSTLEVVRAFAARFLGAAPPPPAAAALRALSQAAAARRPLRGLPVDVMQQVVQSVSPQRLQRSLERALQEAAAAAAAAAAAGQQAPSQPCPLLSPKVAALVCALQRHRQPPAHRAWTALVFVQQRLAALALAALLRALPATSAWLRVSAFMASGPAIGGSSFAPKEQADVLRRFRLGDLNLLVSTAVAEEGIDVRSCQLVVRFDPPPNAQSFLQSRGRARARGSRLVVLLREGDAAGEAAVRGMRAYEAALRGEALANAAVLRREGSSDGSEDEGDAVGPAGGVDEDEDAGGGGEVYRVVATGARVTLHSALALLQRYVSQLPGDRCATCARAELLLW
jgi:ERCC4-related helicase